MRRSSIRTARSGDSTASGDPRASPGRRRGFCMIVTVAERRLLARLRTTLAVQRYLNRLPYNEEQHGRATLRSFRGVVRHGCAHCLEAALFAAATLEQHGYPP